MLKIKFPESSTMSYNFGDVQICGKRGQKDYIRCTTGFQ